MSGVTYPSEIIRQQAADILTFQYLGCESDGTNTEPIAPIDASPSLWQSISNPLDEAILSKIKSLL